MHETFGMLGVFVPIIIFSIPIVAILTKHQREMARIMQGSQQGLPAEIADLPRQVAELRQLVVQQTYMLDEVKRQQALPSPPPTPNA